MVGFSNDFINLLQVIIVPVILITLYSFWGYGLVKVLNFKCIYTIIPVLGFIVDFFLYIIVEVPCCVMDVSLTVCTWIHIILMMIYSISVLIIFKRKNINLFDSNNKRVFKIDEVVIIVVALAVILVIANMKKNYYYFLTADAQWNCNNVGTLLVTDHIYRYDPHSGQYVGFNNASLYFFSYFPYLASLCKTFYVNPALMFYRVFTEVVLIIWVLNFFSIFKLFFKDRKKLSFAMMMFMVFAVCPQDGQGYIYWPIAGGTVTQGIILTIFVPLVTYMLLTYLDNEQDSFWWIFALIMICSSFINRSSPFVVLSLLASMFIPIVIIMIKKRKKIDIFKYMLCCFPGIISVGITYLL